MTLVSIAKAAEILGISRATAYRLARQGQIPCVRSLGPLRIHLEKLNEMMDAEAQASLAGTPTSNPSVTPVSRKRHVQSGHESQAALERELDELLRIAKQTKKRNR
jgi:excisionase family DNA binding protein